MKNRKLSEFYRILVVASLIGLIAVTTFGLYFALVFNDFKYVVGVIIIDTVIFIYTTYIMYE